MNFSVNAPNSKMKGSLLSECIGSPFLTAVVSVRQIKCLFYEQKMADVYDWKELLGRFVTTQRKMLELPLSSVGLSFLQSR